MTADFIHPCRLSPAELLAEVSKLPGRRGGPGGQHRNKTESAMQLCHLPTGVTAQASERRSQADNLRVALERLRRALAIEVRSQTQAAAAPSDLWRDRVRTGQIVVSETHHDFATLLAEALDVLADHEFQLPSTVEQLQVTSSQLIRFLKREPRAWQLVQSARARRGLPELS